MTSDSLATQIRYLLKSFKDGSRPSKIVSTSSLQRLINYLSCEVQDREQKKSGDLKEAIHAQIYLNKAELKFMESVISQFVLPPSSPHLLKRIRTEMDALPGKIFEEEELNPKPIRTIIEFPNIP